jgi:methyl-accepting chemotaxis protein
MSATMQDLSVRLAGGDFSVGDSVPPTNNDEIGAFEAFFGKFLGVVRNTLVDLTERIKQVRQKSAAAPPGR